MEVHVWYPMDSPWLHWGLGYPMCKKVHRMEEDRRLTGSLACQMYGFPLIAVAFKTQNADLALSWSNRRG